jgi:aldehyde:ferredoxin oxidoreductase
VGITTWAYDTWYRYLAGLEQLDIHEVCGERFELANPEWWRDWILKVAHREGLGDDMAEGLARFYDKHQIGPRYLADFIEDAGSRGHGWHREGRAMEPHPSPFWEYAALLYATSTRDVTPSTHDFFFLNGLYGYPKAPKDPSEVSPQFQALAERLFGTRTAAFAGDSVTERVTTWCQHRAIIKDSMVLCDWVFPLMKRNYESREEMLADKEGDLYGDISAEAILYRACTGIDMGIAEMEDSVAERILALERCVEVRNNGRNRQADEAVIPHFQWPEKTDGTHLSADAHEFHALLDRYYALHGWDQETGAPTREKLQALGLDQVFKER